MSATPGRGATVFVCDDEPGIRRTLAQVLGDEGYRPEVFAEGRVLLARLLEPGALQPSAVLLDVWLDDLDGLAILSEVRSRGLDVPVIMISGHGTVETAVAAVKSGADDFLEKPLSLDRVLLTVERAIEKSRLTRERDALRLELASQRALLDEEQPLLGTGLSMSRLLEEVRRVGASELNVLITGESGVGKELVARALHRSSPRASGPFVEVNGAAIPEDLIESELFGHLKGSFTGATEDRKGKWELAHGGTLFLDEVGDMSPRTQAKILRAIQDGKVSRVGSAKAIATDVRIVTATNRDLPRMIGDGSFREDLYFRLAVVPIRVPPLGERTEDIPILVRHFAERLARRRGRRPQSFSAEALEELKRRRWRGNVRELQNLVERALLMTDGPVVDLAGLPAEDPGVRRTAAIGEADALLPGQTLAEAREAFEARVIGKVLAEARGNVSRAAERLGLDRTTLHRKLRAYGIDSERE